MNVMLPKYGLRAALVMSVIAAAALVVGCSAGEATKAGKSTDPVVLRMANAYGHLRYEPAVAYFVRRVSEVSDGALRVTVVDEWGDSDAGAEQEVVRGVSEGKADLGWAGTRIFDTLGVKDFQALTAPMLIDSGSLQRAVISSEIPRQMQAGLRKVDVTGLAVLAGGLRKPIAVERPLLKPDDWQGITFASFRSRGQAAAIQALGATPSDAWGGALTVGIDSGTIQGFEKDLHIYRMNETQNAAPYVTANVNLWPETVALIANPERLSELDDQQERWLTEAAADAAARSPSLVDGDTEDAAAACESGARLAQASASDLAGLERAFARVNAELQRDPRTKAFMSEIERLKRTTPASPALTVPAGCRGKAAVSEPGTTAKRTDSSVLDGTYRIQWSEQELVAAGTSREYAGNAGVWTMSLRDGDVVLRLVGDEEDCRGAYTVSGGTISIALNVGCEGTTTARWSRHGDELHLHVSRATVPGDEIFFGAKPWKDIG